MTYDTKYLNIQKKKQREYNLFQQKEKIQENCSSRRNSYFQTVFPGLTEN